MVPDFFETASALMLTFSFRLLRDVFFMRRAVLEGKGS